MEDNSLKKVIAKLKYEEGKAFLNEIENLKPNYRKWLVVASVIFIAGLSTFFLIQKNLSPLSQDLYAHYFEPYPNNYNPLVRGAEDASTLAFIAYENKDYKASSNLFRDLLAKEDNENIRFYYAVSLLSQGKTKVALKEFNTLESVEFRYQKQVLWYKGLLLLKINKIKAAKKVFERLISKFPSYRYSEIKDLLNEID